MSLKAQIEAIIYATETPVTVEQIAHLVKDSVNAENGAADGSADAPADATAIRARVRSVLDELIVEFSSPDRGIEVRAVAGGYRMATKAEHHDLMRGFAKSLKPPIRLSLPALETLAVIAYKQPATVPEISEIRGVDSGGVIATLLDRKLITTAGRKQVIGRPILYKTTKEFLMRFGLNEVSELPSMEEFEKLVAQSFQDEMFVADAATATMPGNSAAAAEEAAEDAAEEEDAIPEELAEESAPAPDAVKS
jgi:segregation and condensation protein B